MKYKDNIKKRSVVFSTAVTILVFILILLILALSYVFKSSDKAPSIFGHSIYIMDGDGMEPYIKDNAAVIVKNGKLPENEKARYKVALCNIVDGRYSTVLRVFDVVTVEGKTSYLMKNDKSDDSQMITVPSDRVIGTATHQSVFLGKLISFIISKIGIIILVILPCILIVAFQLVKILKKINNDDTDFALNNEEENQDINKAELTDSQDETEDPDESNTEEIEEEVITEEKQPMEMDSEDELPEDSQEERFNELSLSPKALVNDNGEAVYNEKEPTAPKESLDNVLYKTDDDINEDSTKTEQYPSAPKSFEFKASPEDFDKIEKPKLDNNNHQAKEINPFIPPKSAKTKKHKTSNQQIEELLSMINKK